MLYLLRKLLPNIETKEVSDDANLAAHQYHKAIYAPSSWYLKSSLPHIACCAVVDGPNSRILVVVVNLWRQIFRGALDPPAGGALAAQGGTAPGTGPGHLEQPEVRNLHLAVGSDKDVLGF